MILAWASLVLVLALPFLLWPLLRHQDVSAAAGAVRGSEEAGSARQAALLAIEEVELDEASGRLDAADAQLRLAEARSDAERILHRP